MGNKWLNGPDLDTEESGDARIQETPKKDSVRKTVNNAVTNTSENVKNALPAIIEKDGEQQAQGPKPHPWENMPEQQ